MTLKFDHQKPDISDDKGNPPKLGDGNPKVSRGIKNNTNTSYTLQEEDQYFEALMHDNVSFSFISEDSSSQGLFFKPDGTKMYISDGNSNSIYQYTV